MCTLVDQRGARTFTAQSRVMPGQFRFARTEIVVVSGKYVVAVSSYPLDFTFRFVLSEIIAFDAAPWRKFQKNDTRKCLGAVTVDSHFHALGVEEHAAEARRSSPDPVTAASDLTSRFRGDYGVLLDGGVALRGLFLIDKAGVVRHALVNDLPIGRSVDEAIPRARRLAVP